MALPSSGPLSLNQIHIEAGGSSGSICTLNDADIRGIISKDAGTTNSISEYRGQSAETQLPTSGSTINGQVQLKQITASTYISSGGTLRIPSSMWVWSDSTSTAALTIDIPCTIINDGKIIGKGGTGGYGQYPASGYSGVGNGNGQDGGPAIKINSNVSSVTITNSSGAYIAGGGGGGGSSGVEPQNTYAGGGGGAGGGDGGAGGGVGTGNVGGTGGALNAAGNQHTGNPIGAPGGEAGGAGMGSSGEDQRSGGGGGGGRILPGNTTITNSFYVAGGNAGNAGSDGGSGGNTGKAGGGGGWGAAGGRGYRGTFSSASHQCQGGAGGAAIDPTGNSYTLNNNGTLYGSTT